LYEAKCRSSNLWRRGLEVRTSVLIGLISLLLTDFASGGGFLSPIYCLWLPE